MTNIVFEIWNLQKQVYKAFIVYQIHCEVHGDIRVEVHEGDDPVFLKTKDDMIEYEGELYGDYSCYPVPPCGGMAITTTKFNIKEAI